MMLLEVNEYLDMLKVVVKNGEEYTGPLYDFTKWALENHSSIDKLIHAEKVCSILLKFLENKEVYVPGCRQTVVDVLLSAALLHNLYFDYKEYINGNNNWEKLFLARKELYNKGIDIGLEDEILNAIFAAIESQLGAKTPVKTLRPAMGTPTESFATTVWIVNEVLEG